VPALPAGASLHGTAASVNLFTPSLSNVVIIGDQGIALRTLDLFGLTGLTLQPAFTSSNLLAICFGSRYVTVGQNGAIFHSADGNGTSWMAGSVTPAPITQNLNSVSFGAGLYVAVGDAGANAFSSN
jgi:photosystem II stability/assembly factor-like uncharacterized protein